MVDASFAVSRRLSTRLYVKVLYFHLHLLICFFYVTSIAVLEDSYGPTSLEFVGTKGPSHLRTFGIEVQLDGELHTSVGECS